jgi:CheY-like chemotaxis protein
MSPYTDWETMFLPKKGQSSGVAPLSLHHLENPRFERAARKMLRIYLSLYYSEQTSQVDGHIIGLLFRNAWASCTSETRTKVIGFLNHFCIQYSSQSDEEADMSRTVFASNGDASCSFVGRRKQVLCSDDHEDTRALIALWLDLSGYEVTTVSCLAETLSLAQKGNFDLFILDSWYGDGLGVDLCKQIRRFDPRTPILFLSALAFQSDIDKGLAAGAQAYLTKPCDFDVLGETIEKFIL